MHKTAKNFFELSDHTHQLLLTHQILHFVHKGLGLLPNS